MINLILAATITLSGGVSTSENMGENGTGVISQSVVQIGSLRARGFYNTIDKVETGDGNILGADLDYVERSTFSPVIGVGLRHRSTSRWSKDSIWVRLGLRYGPFEAVLFHDMNSINKVTSGELVARVCKGMICGEQRVGSYSYLQSGEREIGYSFETLIGVRFGD